jgi:alkanesulfonate monooxygenase SsuD/methylene tetrahydromethanopterin reductase-like flavin-dependent oxidoreductase (luciferase family)
MDREGQTSTAGRVLAKRLGRVGLWTRQLDIQPTEQVRAVLAELEALGWDSLWFWEVFGREALTNAGLLLCATQRTVIASGIANIWARDPLAMAAAQRTLTEAYPGRFVLGVGVSHAPIVDARGHHYQRPLGKMRAYLDAMDAAPCQVPGRGRRWRSSRRGCWLPSAPACWRSPRSGLARCWTTPRRRRPRWRARCSARGRCWRSSRRCCWRRIRLQRAGSPAGSSPSTCRCRTTRGRGTGPGSVRRALLRSP